MPHRWESSPVCEVPLCGPCHLSLATLRTFRQTNKPLSTSSEGPQCREHTSKDVLTIPGGKGQKTAHFEVRQRMILRTRNAGAGCWSRSWSLAWEAPGERAGTETQGSEGVHSPRARNCWKFRVGGRREGKVWSWGPKSRQPSEGS